MMPVLRGPQRPLDAWRSGRSCSSPTASAMPRASARWRHGVRERNARAYSLYATRPHSAAGQRRSSGRRPS